VRLKKSKLENLYRHANSLHYARVRVNGKAKERSLELKDYNTASDLLPEILTKMSGAPDERKGDTAFAVHPAPLPAHWQEDDGNDVTRDPRPGAPPPGDGRRRESLTTPTIPSCR
jgi:hypothetical protein